VRHCLGGVGDLAIPTISSSPHPHSPFPNRSSPTTAASSPTPPPRRHERRPHHPGDALLSSPPRPDQIPPLPTAVIGRRRGSPPGGDRYLLPLPCVSLRPPSSFSGPPSFPSSPSLLHPFPLAAPPCHDPTLTLELWLGRWFNGGGRWFNSGGRWANDGTRGARCLLLSSGSTTTCHIHLFVILDLQILWRIRSCEPN
jgi:hypothetical protein